MAQNVTFGLSSATGAPGSTVALDISMDSPTGTSPASAEWTLNYPGVDFSSASVASTTAGKSVSCEMGVGAATCILWADNNAVIANGVAATVSLVISDSTPDTSSLIQLSNPMVVSSDAFPFTATPTSGTVTIVQPAALNGFTCTPVSITPPAVSACTVQLTTTAPSAGATIVLSASPSEVSIPSAVTIPAGQSSAIFTVTPLAVVSPTAVNLDATYLGVMEGFGLTINPPPITLTGISVLPNILFSGQTASGSVTLSGPAGSGGASIGLSSSSAAVSVPLFVTVPQGASTAGFPVTAGTVTTLTPVLVTGSYNGATQTAPLTLDPPPTVTLFSLNPPAIQIGQTSTATVTISAPAGSGGLTIGLISANPSAGAVPASVTIPQGATTATFTATAGIVTKWTQFAITASSPTNQMSAHLVVRR